MTAAPTLTAAAPVRRVRAVDRHRQAVFAVRLAVIAAVLVIWQVNPGHFLPSYAFAARFRPPALGLQLRRARELGLPVDDRLVRGIWARWSGDRTELSRGEILIFDEEDGHQ